MVSQYRAINGPPALVTSNCEILPIVSWAPLSYAASFAFNTFILLLTIWKIPDHRHTKSPVAYLIFRDSLLYFLFTTVVGLVVLSIQSLSSDNADIKPTAIPIAAVTTATMGSRLFLNLKLLNQRKDPDPVASRLSHSKSFSTDDSDHMSKYLPTLPSTPKTPPTPEPQAKRTHTSQDSFESSAATLNEASYDLSRFKDSYIGRTPPPMPPRQSIPEDITLQDDRELHSLLMSYHVRHDENSV